MNLSTRVKSAPALTLLGALLVSGCETIPTGPAVNTEGTTDNPAVEEVVGTQQLRQDVAQLRNQVEMQGNELRQLQERQRQLYDDLDQRLRRLGGSASSQPGYGQGGSGAEQAASGASRDTTADQAEQDVYGQQGIAGSPGEEADQAPAQTSAPAPQVTEPAPQQAAAADPDAGAAQRQSSQNAVASGAEQSAYDGAFELLKQSRYNDAIIEFRSMIGQFPNGALADDAQYWIGEAYYVTRDFESALDAFSTVVNRYPDSQRVPEALLKQGYVQAELGRPAAARETLNQVISRYPGSRVAISAETRLSKIR